MDKFVYVIARFVSIHLISASISNDGPQIIWKIKYQMLPDGFFSVLASQITFRLANGLGPQPTIPPYYFLPCITL